MEISENLPEERSIFEVLSSLPQGFDSPERFEAFRNNLVTDEGYSIANEHGCPNPFLEFPGRGSVVLFDQPVEFGKYIIFGKLNRPSNAIGAIFYGFEKDNSKNWVIIRRINCCVGDPHLVERFSNGSDFLFSLGDDDGWIKLIETVKAPILCPGRYDDLGIDSRDVVMHQVIPFIAPGLNLYELCMMHRTMRTDEAVSFVGLQLCKACASAHERGIIIRDIKPSNIMIASPKLGKGSVVSIDPDYLFDRKKCEHLTARGSVFGTPEYMSPEMVSGVRDLDPQSDIYILGCVLYFVATGKSPFNVGNGMEIMRQQIFSEIDADNLAHLDPVLRKLILWMMNKRPSRRPDSVQQIARILQHYVTNPDLRALLGSASDFPPSARFKFPIAQFF